MLGEGGAAIILHRTRMAAIATTTPTRQDGLMARNADAPALAIQSLCQPVLASECLDAIELTKIAVTTVNPRLRA